MKDTFSLREEVEKLEAIESYFQQPDMKLEEAIQRHQEALAVAKRILAYLEKAETTIQQLDLRSMNETDRNEESIIS